MSRWPTVRLGEVLELAQRPDVVDATLEYRLLGVRLESRGPFLREIKTGAETSAKTLFRVRAGDFIYSRLFAWRGAFGVIPPQLDGCHVSTEFPIFVSCDGGLDPQYLNYWFRLPAILERIAADCTGSTPLTRNRYKEHFFLELEIPLPPIEEQRRVVEKLNRLANRAATARTARLRADADSLALRRVLYAKAERDASRRGARVPLSSLIASHDSGWSPQCEDGPAPPGLWGVLKTTCVQWDGFRAGANKALRPALAPRPELAVRRGDILITRAGPVNRVGVACVVPEDHACLMLSDKIVRTVPAPDVDPDFIVAMLGAPSAQEYFRQSKTGLAASQVNISRARLLALEVPLPALHEQRRLAKALLRSLSALDRCTQKREEGTPVVAAFERAMLRVAFA